MDARPQPGILAPLTSMARYLTFDLRPGGEARAALAALRLLVDGERCVCGVGVPTALTLGAKLVPLRAFPSHAGPAVSVPSTPAGFWLWQRGDDRGVLLHEGRKLEAALAPGFVLREVVDAFMYREGRDLSGYVDGTENPQEEAAVEAAIAPADGRAPAGSSFVAVQTWVHDLDRFETMDPKQRDHMIGRSLDDNEELDDAPAWAHVKRTAQETFSPPAFVLRRSMPFSDGRAHGLVFVAFGRTLDAFETILQRMVGAEDGIPDALFRFTRPINGSSYWCPPLGGDGLLDFSPLGVK